MTELYPVFFAAAALVVLSALEILFFRLLNRRWWRYRLIRRASFLLPVSGLIAVAAWTLGLFALNKTVMIVGSLLTALILILILALLLSLPISGLVNFVHDVLEKRGAGDTAADADFSAVMPRRRFLRGVAALAPVVALSSGLSGVAHAFTDVTVYRRPIVCDGLPPELDGFRILHLSDIHIGYYVWLEHVERLLELAAVYTPDILLATGDLSDRLDVYGDLLRLFEQFHAPLGAFASVGNHEYYRGFTSVRKIFDRSRIPLLLNDGVITAKNGFPVYVGGADDPRYLSRMSGGFFRESIDRALASYSGKAFRILLCHRPVGFDDAAKRQVDLTLAGHTHGAQLGFAGRSLFEPMAPKSYLWGEYRRGRSLLYTTSGVGHWFPFRLGCPAEAPILELRRGDA